MAKVLVMANYATQSISSPFKKYLTGLVGSVTQASQKNTAGVFKFSIRI